ncbi:hypothetical protein [Heliomicrobium modesticaldum]|uniref:hypothetical protein n=1 Tax=Heliomicrobium modesticaldum TaxID=35701 RepID=UPI0007DBF698|nr:hypothetical protein [Heliomicrobium modesticaldum]
MERAMITGISDTTNVRGIADSLNMHKATEPKVVADRTEAAGEAHAEHWSVIAVEVIGLKGQVKELEARVVSIEKQLEILARHLAYITSDPFPLR